MKLESSREFLGNIAIITALTVFMTSISIAQNNRNRSIPTEDRSEEWSQQGVASYKNGNYASALEMFRKVDLSRYPELRINIARTYAKLNKEEDAIKQIDLYLDSASVTKRAQSSDFRKEAKHTKSVLSLSWAQKLAEVNPNRAIELARITAGYQDDEYGTDEAELSSQRRQAWTLILKITCKDFMKRPVLFQSAVQNLLGLMDSDSFDRVYKDFGCVVWPHWTYRKRAIDLAKFGDSDLPENITNDVIKGYVYGLLSKPFRDCRKTQDTKSTAIRFSLILSPNGTSDRVSYSPWEHEFGSNRNDMFFYKKCVHDLIDTIPSKRIFPLSKAESRAIISMDPWVNFFATSKKGN